MQLLLILNFGQAGRLVDEEAHLTTPPCARCRKRFLQQSKGLTLWVAVGLATAAYGGCGRLGFELLPASGDGGGPTGGGGTAQAGGGAESGGGVTDGGTMDTGGMASITGGMGSGEAGASARSGTGPGTSGAGPGGGGFAATGGTGPGGKGGDSGTGGAPPSTGGQLQGTGGTAGSTGGLGTGGSGTTGGAGGDAGASATGGTTPLGTFGAPVLIAALSHSASDDDPTVTEDLLELYFNSDRPGGPGNGDIWVSQRASVSDAWGAPVLLPELSSSEVDSTPKVAPDGLTLWLSSDRGGCTGNVDVWVSTRASRTDPWSAPVCVPELSSAANDQGPAPSPTLLEMVISSDRNGTVGDPRSLDIYLATRASTSAAWGTPVALAEVNSPRTDGDARLVAGGLELYLSSNRTGGDGTDFYLATRSTTAEPFASPELITELNSTGDETDPWITSDRRHIFFTSDRGRDNEIYEAAR